MAPGKVHLIVFTITGHRFELSEEDRPLRRSGLPDLWSISRPYCVIAITGPGTLMIRGVPIGNNVARIRRRDMAEEKDPFNVTQGLSQTRL